MKKLIELSFPPAMSGAIAACMLLVFLPNLQHSKFQVYSQEEPAESVEYHYKVAYSITRISENFVKKNATSKEIEYWENKINNGDLEGWQYVGVLNSTNPGTRNFDWKGVKDEHGGEWSGKYNFDATVTYTLWRKKK